MVLVGGIMYIDVAIIIIILLIVMFFFRRFSSFVYSVAIIDIFLRILTFLKNNLAFSDVQFFISKYFPESLEAIINKYTADILNTILMWVLAVIYMIFLYYITVYFIHKRK